MADTTTPTISVRITTSSPILDLSTNTPFTITLTLSLNFKYQITFDKHFAGLFDGKTFNQGGLTFINTSTNESITRSNLDICYRSYDSDGLPKDENKNSFITLQPGQDHVVDATFKPTLAKPLFRSEWGERTTAEMIAEEQGTLPMVWKWYGTGGFEDGQTYEVGVSEEAVIREWIQGSVEGIIAVQKLGLEPPKRREIVRYQVVEPGRFAVERPDEDGSLNWP